MKGNLNTILVTISLAVLVWVGNATYANSIRLAEINGSLISRQEIEAKLASTRTEIQHIDLQVQEVKLEIAKMKVGMK